jgi:hypothetical protein
MHHPPDADVRAQREQHQQQSFAQLAGRDLLAGGDGGELGVKPVSQSASVSRSSRPTTPQRRITSSLRASRLAGGDCAGCFDTVIHTWFLRVPITAPLVPARSASANLASAVSTRVRRLATNSVGSWGWAMAM